MSNGETIWPQNITSLLKRFGILKQELTQHFPTQLLYFVFNLIILMPKMYNH